MTLRLSKNEILSSIKTIIADKDTLNKRQLEHKWMSFMNTYPIIFVQLIDNDNSSLDMKLIESMIDDVVKIDTGEKSNEEAELDLGNELAERYIYTKVNRPEPQDLFKAYKKLVDENKINLG